MEVSQAIWLVLFFSDALLISPKRFDEIILDFYQDAGIWIVIASCVAEYLLLLTYIGVAAYDFFKNRKMMKKMNVQRRTYEFLKFDESHRDVGNRWREPVVIPGTFAGPRMLFEAKPVKYGAKAFAVKNAQRNLKIRPLSKRPMKISESDNAPNNPQLLKFDSNQSLVQHGNWSTSMGNIKGKRRWMNKSLKRKQIE